MLIYISLSLSLLKVFVHGAITAKGLLYVPNMELKHRHLWLQTPPGKFLPLTTDIDIWFQELNILKDKCLKDYLQRPHWEGEGGNNVTYQTRDYTPDGHLPHYDWSRRRGGEPLLALQSFAASSGCNVCVEAYCKFNQHSYDNANPMDEKVYLYLKTCQINKVIVGHKPVGVTPLILRYSPSSTSTSPPPPTKTTTTLSPKVIQAGLWEQGEALNEKTFPCSQCIEVVCCDTSFSDPTSKIFPTDKRGIVACDLTLKYSRTSMVTNPNPNSDPNPSFINDDMRIEVCFGDRNVLGQAVLTGVLSQNEKVTGHFDHKYVGKCTSDGWWVVLQEEQQSNDENNHNDKEVKLETRFLLSRTLGRDVTLLWLSEQDLILKFSS